MIGSTQLPIHMLVIIYAGEILGRIADRSRDQGQPHKKGIGATASNLGVHLHRALPPQKPRRHYQRKLDHAA